MHFPEGDLFPSQNDGIALPRIVPANGHDVIRAVDHNSTRATLTASLGTSNSNGLTPGGAQERDTEIAVGSQILSPLPHR
jgi:hypothetical protein